MILYHFPTSPFARRARLALAHKGLSAELRDARNVPAHMEELRRLNPLHTVPVLVDGERVVVDSTAIAHYLDAKVPSSPLFPSGAAGAEAIELLALADTAVTILVDLALRYGDLTDHARFPAVRAEMLGRAQAALDRVGERVASKPPGAVAGSWSFVDMGLLTMVLWAEGLPERAKLFAPAKKVLDLAWTMPPALHAWADQHRERADVRALG